MITVVRMGHRVFRDDRITTHCGLVSRAFGANNIIISGDKDDKCVESINTVAEQWGGKFSAKYVKKWKDFIIKAKKDGAVIVHLTMYGKNLGKVKSNVRKAVKGKDLLVLVGSQKVPAEAYELADFNVAVGNTPHSEISALAIFLYEILGKDMLEREFKDSKIKVEGSVEGSKIIDRIQD